MEHPPGAIHSQTATIRRWVGFGDLDLNKDEGIQELYRRIRGAARTVCNKAVPDFVPFSIPDRWQKCYREAVGNAVAQLNNSRLTALHRQQNETKRPG